MALGFDKQGQYQKALELYERALAGRQKALGVDHSYTQTTLRGLANLHKRAGQTEQAQGLQARLHTPKSP